MVTTVNDEEIARVTRLVGSLTVPDPWNIVTFVDGIAAQRERAIYLLPCANLDGSALPCGVWLGRESDDIILYAERTSSYHAEQIILHELGHMLLGHGDDADSAHRQTGVQDLLPDLNATTVRSILGRAAFASAQEREAELFASLILSQRRLPAGSRLLATLLGR